MQAVRDITLGRASLAHCKEELRLFSASTVPGTPPFGRAAQCPRTGAAPSVRGQRRQVVLQSVRPLQRHFPRLLSDPAGDPDLHPADECGDAPRHESAWGRVVEPRGGAASMITALSHTGRRTRVPAIVFVLAPSLCSAVGTVRALSRRVDGCKLPGRRPW